MTLHSRKIEVLIASKVVDALLATGGTVDVFDGEETTLRNSRERGAILRALATTDEDYLRLAGGQWVRLIWGNGEDLISDYSVGLKEVLAPVCAWVEDCGFLVA